VWAGGAMFVLSLAVCAYTYIFTWATPSRAGAGRALAVDVVLMAIFGAHHSLFARERLKRSIERIVPRRLLRSTYVWAASLLLVAVLILWAPIGGEIYRTQGVAALGLTIVQLAGVFLIARSVATIDPLELAGIHAESQRQRLQVTGPYRLVRHPLYLGWLLAVFGAPHMTGDRLAFAALTTVYLAMAIPWEERSLLAAFGSDYAHYQQRVRWKLVPYLY
jgi:protein-S-isoprenylcysteine O-methyltransferase Ste14